MGGGLKSQFSAQMKPEEQRHCLSSSLMLISIINQWLKIKKTGGWLKIILSSSDHRFMRENFCFKT